MEAPIPADASDVPPERALLVIDMKGYSQIPEAKMAPVRSDLDDILSTVFDQSGLTDAEAAKDTGDGGIYMWPTRHTARLVDPLLGYLDAALARYDRMRLASAPSIRIRASVHVGPLSMSDHRGDAINEACRLVDSGVVRQGMTAAVDNGASLAAVVSEAAFRRTVSAGRTPRLEERHFLPATARVEGKEGFEEACRILVPGVVPAALRSYLRATEHETPRRLPDSDSGQKGPGASGPGEPQGGMTQKAKASGHARIVQVGRDQNTIRPKGA